MCGIVGYSGTREALPVLVDSLARVTYRGYDSYGVAVLNGSGIDVFRRVGAVDDKPSDFHADGTVGIGHTRWATIGGISELNAHPHLDCSGQFAIVHNGDIDNYLALRAELEAEGHTVRSDTDSELIAHLIEKYRDRGIVSALERASRDLDGCFAVAVLSYESREIVVTRRGSPVVIGLGDGEAFVASDAPAIVGKADRVIYPEDGDIVLISAGSVKIFSDGKVVVREERTLDWDQSTADKLGYEHYMIKEIHEQADAVRDTLTRYRDGLPPLPMTDPEHVLMLACGTSYHSALLGESLLTRLGGVSASAQIASEFEPDRPVPDGTLVVAISQSGETADTLNAVRALKAKGCMVIGITNVPESNLAREADSVIYTAAGPEIAVAATKTFTTQLAVLSLLASQFAGRHHAAGLPDEALKLPSQIEITLSLSNEIAAVGNWLANHDNMFVIAKGDHYPVALEAALKLKEVAYIHAEGVPAGELKHGPFALLQQDTPVLALVADDKHRARMITTMREIAARGAPIVTVTDRRDAEIDACSRYVIELPAARGIFSTVIFTVATQLLSYYAAKARGCPIDRPRNLAKSVTVP